MDLLATVRDFVRAEFIKHPHHSFGDAAVMYDHCLKVEQLGQQLAQGQDCNLFALSIAALLHDIGKTYEADEQTLHAEHESFNLAVCQRFLKQLELPADDLSLVEALIADSSSSMEAIILHDADILAFFMDARLNILFIDWAKEKGLEESIEKKLGNYDRLVLAESKELGREPYGQMRESWGY